MSKSDPFMGQLVDVVRITGRGVILCVDIRGGSILNGDRVSINGMQLVARSIEYVDRIDGTASIGLVVGDEDIDLLKSMIGAEVIGLEPKKGLLNLVGEIDLDPDIDHKQARRSRYTTA